MPCLTTQLLSIAAVQVKVCMAAQVNFCCIKMQTVKSETSANSELDFVCLATPVTSSVVTNSATLTSVNTTQGMSTVPSVSSVTDVNERTGEGPQGSKVEGYQATQVRKIVTVRVIIVKVRIIMAVEGSQGITGKGFHDPTFEGYQGDW